MRGHGGTLLSEQWTGAPTPHSQSRFALNSQIEFITKWTVYMISIINASISVFVGVSFSAMVGKFGCVEVSNRKKNLFRLTLSY